MPAASWLSLSLWTILTVTGLMGGFFLLIARLVARTMKQRPAVGREALVGQIVRARTPLDPNGMVWLDGALWEATVDGDSVAAGGRVEVLEVDGLHLRVRPARQGTAEGMAFSRTELDALLQLAETGLMRITDLQAELLATPPAAR